MYSLAHRILKKLDPELSHNLSIKALKLGIYPKITYKNTEILEQTIWGRTFKTPIGLSAGFDKNAEVINPCLLYTSPSPRDLWISRMPSSA